MSSTKPEASPRRQDVCDSGFPSGPSRATDASVTNFSSDCSKTKNKEADFRNRNELLTENSTSSCSGHGCPALAGLATVNCPRLDARKLKRCARKCLSLQKTQSSKTFFLQPLASPPPQPQSWARSRYKLCSSCLTRCCPPLWWSFSIAR